MNNDFRLYHSALMEEDSLKHHGIKGQKWGDRNGPPYPLDSNISTGKSLKKDHDTKKKVSNKNIDNAAESEKVLKGFTKQKSSYNSNWDWYENNNVKVKDSFGKKTNQHYMYDSKDHNNLTVKNGIKDFTKNYSEHDKALRKHLSQFKEDFYDWTDKKMSLDEFWKFFNKDTKNNNLFYFSEYKGSITVEANYWPDSDFLGGHEITIEYDPVTKKCSVGYAING